MKPSHFLWRIVAVGLLVLLPGCIAFGPPPGHEPVEFFYYIRVPKPPANAPTVEEAPSTYSQMLAKGYARVGEVGCFNYTFGATDSGVKDDLLNAGRKYGAQIAWLSTSRNSTSQTTATSGGTYTSYNPSSLGYMGASGTGGSTTTVTFGPGLATTKYNYISGHATLFAHDPELAAWQLQKGREAWAAQAPVIPVARATMLAKLTSVQTALKDCDSASLNRDKPQDYLKSTIQQLEFLKDGVQSNRVYNGVYHVFEPLKPLTIWSDLDYLERDTSDNASSGSTYRPDSYPLFKSPLNPQRSKLHHLVIDAIDYAAENADYLCDFTTQTQPERILIDYPVVRLNRLATSLGWCQLAEWPQFATLAWSLEGLDNPKAIQVISDFMPRNVPRHSTGALFVLRGLRYASAGQHDQAIADFTRAINDFTVKSSYRLRAISYLAANKAELAISDLTRAIDESASPRADLPYYRAIAYTKLQRWAEAPPDFSQSISLDNTASDTYMRRGIVYLQLEKYPEALADQTKAIEITPNAIEPYYYRAKPLERLGRYAAAFDDYRKALQLAPDDAESLNALAWGLLTCPDESLRNPLEALVVAHKAVSKSPNDWAYLDTLACAYAATGDFALAIETEKKAIELCPDAKNRQTAEKVLQGFQQGKTYHQQTQTPK